MSGLYVTCRRCSGWGSIETSQSEDGRFSYQDQCPECSSQGVVPATPADVLAYVRTLPGVEEVCECGVLKSKHRKSVMPHYKAASLVVPLSEEAANG